MEVRVRVRAQADLAPVSQSAPPKPASQKQRPWWHAPWWEHWSGPQAAAASQALPPKPGSQKHWSCLGRGRGRGRGRG